MNENPILLILATDRKLKAGVEKAMEMALDKNKELLVLYIHDLKLSEATVNAMTEGGWLGGKATDELFNVMQREYLIQGNALIDHIKGLCQRKGIRCRGILRGGDFVEEALRVLDEEGVEEAVAIRRKRSNVTRFFFRSVIDDLTKKSNRKIEIVDED